MARPIKDKPSLRGQDAQTFIRRAREAESGRNPEPADAYERAMRVLYHIERRDK